MLILIVKHGVRNKSFRISNTGSRLSFFVFLIGSERRMTEKKKGKKKGAVPAGEEEEKLTKLEKAVAHWLRDQHSRLQEFFCICHCV